MNVTAKLRRLDERVLGPATRCATRRRTRRFGFGLLGIVALEYVGSFWDPTLSRPAAGMALIAGLALGRVQEHDAAKRGLGLVDSGDGA